MISKYQKNTSVL